MSSRDDIVFRPSVGKRERPRSVRRAIEERRHERTYNRGLRRRLAQLQAAARLRRLGRAKTRAAMSRVSVASARGLGAASSGRSALGAAARAGVVGVAVGAAVVGIIALTRVLSGRSLENLGATLNKAVLGDLDEEARARMEVKRDFQGDANVARFIQQRGGVTDELRQIGGDLIEMRKRKLVGASLFVEDPDFQVNSNLEILATRAATKLGAVWRSEGMPDVIQQVNQTLQQVNEMRSLKHSNSLPRLRWPPGVLRH